MRWTFGLGIACAACASSGSSQPGPPDGAASLVEANTDDAASGDANGNGAPDAPSGGRSDSGGPNDAGMASSEGGEGGGGGTGCLEGGAPSSAYDQLVLCDHPVAYWTMKASTGTEPDVSGHGNTGTYMGGAPATAKLPNGDTAANFNGSSQYLTIPSNASLSIPTTGNLTWEGWIQPAVLVFTHESGGYVDWMGKCASYSPTCEWEARLYDTTNSQGRCNRMSAYVFNPSAGLGSAADWQPTCGLVTAGTWYYIVGEYTTVTAPADCTNTQMYPGSIDVWVDGVKWDQAQHNPTGCMSQYSVAPKANSSPVNIGTMAMDTWFEGAIGKVAVYGYLLSQTQITAHYQTMTGKAPTGSCANTCSL
jgi:hypothetical protein